jgi:catechol 2,3-dioxygenase-like lactoylglutathione lyase family enzyme
LIVAVANPFELTVSINNRKSIERPTEKSGTGIFAMITGVNHITFAVRDLDRSFRFYTEALGLQPKAKWYKGAHLLAGNEGVCLALDPERDGRTASEYTHTAFNVSREDFQPAVEKLKTYGAESWQTNHSYGLSFYFLDPDGHRLELHANPLGERLEHLRLSPPKDLILFS